MKLKYRLADNPPLFFVYYVTTKPFRNIGKVWNRLRRSPNPVLFFSIIVTISFLFFERIKLFVVSLDPEINIMFIAMCFITLIIYLWKYTDSELGQGWKSELAMVKKYKKDAE